MDDKKLIFELNKILTLEHGHLGLYKNFKNHQDKEIRRTFRRFMEIEVEHINKIKTVIINVGAKPSILIESGDILGGFFGFTINTIDHIKMLQSYSHIEKASHQGYTKFVAQLENSDSKNQQYIAEIAAANGLEAKLMQLWLEDKVKQSKP